MLAVTDAVIVSRRGLGRGLRDRLGDDAPRARRARGRDAAGGQAEVIGAVLNRVDFDRNKYYYSRYYGYQYKNYYGSATPAA